MPQFQPDTVTFGDYAGYGMWDDNHYREHEDFVTALAQQTPPIVIPNSDFIRFLTSGGARSSIINSHMAVHYLLRQATGVGGTDYQSFNLDDESDFYNFTGYHATEHAALRAALGIV
jgi:hypothetical protein